MDKDISTDFLSNKNVHYLVNKSPLFMDEEEESHVLIFRKILEISMSQGRWSGDMPVLS